MVDIEDDPSHRLNHSTTMLAGDFGYTFDADKATCPGCTGKEQK
jgi:hypothetical protein